MTFMAPPLEAFVYGLSVCASVCTEGC